MLRLPLSENVVQIITYFAVDLKYMALGQEAQWAELCVLYKLHLNYLSRKLI